MYYLIFLQARASRARMCLCARENDFAVWNTFNDARYIYLFMRLEPEENRINMTKIRVVPAANCVYSSVILTKEQRHRVKLSLTL